MTLNVPTDPNADVVDYTRDLLKEVLENAVIGLDKMANAADEAKDLNEFVVLRTATKHVAHLAANVTGWTHRTRLEEYVLTYDPDAAAKTVEAILTDHQTDSAEQLHGGDPTPMPADPPQWTDWTETKPGQPIIPLDQIRLGDVITIHGLDEDTGERLADEMRITGEVVRIDDHDVVIPPMGKLGRYNGYLCLDSTGDMFDLVDVRRDGVRLQGSER